MWGQNRWDLILLSVEIETIKRSYLNKKMVVLISIIIKKLGFFRENNDLEFRSNVALDDIQKIAL
jgi:hypothetical protein